MTQRSFMSMKDVLVCVCTITYSANKQQSRLILWDAVTHCVSYEPVKTSAWLVEITVTLRQADSTNIFP